MTLKRKELGKLANRMESNSSCLKYSVKSWMKLRDSTFYPSVFVDLDLTKSERESQYQLRLEKLTLQENYSATVFVIKNGKVIEKR